MHCVMRLLYCYVYNYYTIGNLRNMMRHYAQRASHVPFHLQLVVLDANMYYYVCIRVELNL